MGKKEDTGKTPIDEQDSGQNESKDTSTNSTNVSQKESDDLVQVKTSDLKELLSNYKELEERVGILTEATNQNSLLQAQNKARPKDKPQIFLKKFQGKVVIGWKSATSKIVYNPTTGAPIGEVIQGIYTFLDGSDSGPVDQIDFTRSEDRVYARVVDNQDEHFVVEFEDKTINKNKPLTIHKAFVNP